MLQKNEEKLPHIVPNWPALSQGNFSKIWQSWSMQYPIHQGYVKNRTTKNVGPEGRMVLTRFPWIQIQSMWIVSNPIPLDFIANCVIIIYLFTPSNSWLIRDGSSFSRQLYCFKMLVGFEDYDIKLLMHHELVLLRCFVFYNYEYALITTCMLSHEPCLLGMQDKCKKQSISVHSS